MMTDMEFLQILSGIDEDLVTQADRPVPFRKKRGFKIALIAAVLAFILLITPVAGAFALAIKHFTQQDAINNPNEPQAPTQDDVQQDVMPGGLVGELFGGIDWNGLKETIGNDGNMNWGAILDVLLGKDKISSATGEFEFSSIQLDDGTVMITEYYLQNESIVTIPAEYMGAKVTAIGEGAFKDNHNITHVSIPDTVTVIEQAAFSNCANLLTVDLGEGVQEISGEAFAYCSSLTSITLPSTLKKLGENAFVKCESLTKIDLPTGLTEISAYAFYGIPITEISIPATVISIGDYAFANCSELSKITFDTTAVVLSSKPATQVMGVEYVGAGAFESTAISTITFPYTLTNIYDIDFKGCMELEEVIFTGNAPTVHKEPSADKSAPDNQNAPDYTVYYMLNSQGFTKPEWHGYTCELMAYQSEQFVLKRFKREHYTEVPMYNVEVLGGLSLSGLDEVTVLDSYKEYEAFSHMLTSTRYNREYFEEFAIVLIQVEQCSSEQVLGLAGIGAQLYTTGGVYYLGLYPVVKFDCGVEGQDMTDDIFNTYVLAEVKRSDIRTDDVTRVGSVYAYDIHTQSSSAYHPGLIDEGK
ncbi:MAG: leucine-rich repeat domain-containing protein [Clostridia bacterium]|nr:leucine-rich repeat domain-containing protein [Clostridia bacterium]